VSKVIFTADIHFGVPGRLRDILYACRCMRQYAKVNDIDTVVILGDLFHERKAIEIDVLNVVFNFFSETKEEYGQNWITFPGNHDMYLRHSWEINSLKPLSNVLTIIEDVKILMLDDQRFWVVPFIQYEKAYMRVVGMIKLRVQPGDKLLTHIGVRGATLNTCFMLKDWSYVCFDKMGFEKIYTGHFHSYQQVGENVFYPGSPIPFKFDEGNIPHGFLVYDTILNEHEFIDLWDIAESMLIGETPPPQYHTILDEQLDDLEVEDVQNNMLRISLAKEYTAAEKTEIKDRLLNMGARAVRWLDTTIKSKLQVKPIMAHAENTNLFQNWLEIDKDNLKGLDKSILFAAHNEVVQMGDEKYLMENPDME